jgi:hypothetical protein
MVFPRASCNYYNKYLNSLSDSSEFSAAYPTEPADIGSFRWSEIAANSYCWRISCNYYFPAFLVRINYSLVDHDIFKNVMTEINSKQDK